MSLIDVIKTIREVEAFISESVSKSDEGDRPKRRKRVYSSLAIIITLSFFLNLHVLAFDFIKETLAPPPREPQNEVAKDPWAEYLEERISKGLERIYELESLLSESQTDLKISEEERARLEAKIEELQKELDELSRVYRSDDTIPGISLYERLNDAKGD